MNDFKTYILSVIITSVVLQTGSIILKDTKYNILYSSISSVIMITVLFSMISSLSNVLPVGTKIDKTENYKSMGVEHVFSRKLENKIVKDVAEHGFGNSNVYVETDWTNLKIVIKSDIKESDKYLLEEYIRENYCTPGDVVSVVEYN